MCKTMFTLLVLVATTFVFTGCSGGEADYSFSDVLDAQNKNLVTGSVQFDVHNTYVVEENSTVVTVIKTDSTSSGVFSIVGGTDGSLFAIDKSTGKLSFITKPSYFVGQDNEYEVVVGVRQSDELSTFTLTVRVVQDITKVKPIIDYIVEKVDAVISNAVLTQIKARPADENSQLTFSLDNNYTLFQINNRGEISLTTPLPDFASMTEKEFSLDVSIVDGYGNNISVGPISVTLVENENLIRPIIETTAVNVIENSLGATQIQVTVLGTGTVNQYILGGIDKAYFDLSLEGVLAFKEAKDYETPPSVFNVTIQVGDNNGNLSELQAIVVTVNDLDEKFTFQGISTFTPMEGEKLVGTVVATPNVLTTLPAQYSLIHGGDLLNINEEGNIEFQGVALKGQNIAVQVQAKSELKGSETLSEVFYVTVQENPAKILPTFNTYATGVNVNDPVNEATSFMSVLATPQGSSTEITYETIGEDAAKIMVDVNGRLFFTGESGAYARKDANTDNVYKVQVRVTDNNNNVRTSDVIAITLNVDETISFDNVSDFDVDDDDSIRVYRTLNASSAQGYTMIYGVINNFDTSKINVTVDGVSGELSVTGDYKSFSNNEHSITIFAKDIYGNTVSQVVEITMKW